MNKILIMFSETARLRPGYLFQAPELYLYAHLRPEQRRGFRLSPIITAPDIKGESWIPSKLSTFIAVGIMLIGLIIFQVFPEGLLKLFNASDHMLEVGVPALRIISTSFLFAGYCIILGSVFQALGNGVYSLIVSVARQLLCILPWLMYLPVWQGSTQFGIPFRSRN